MRASKEKDEQFQRKYEELLLLSGKSPEADCGREDKNSAVYQKYSLDTKSGFGFYKQISDEQLLEILKKRAEELNHSPAQKEVFWVWRDYIKKRFSKWPYALRAAGLSRSAGMGGKTMLQMNVDKEEYRMLLEEVRKTAEKLCRIPHPQEVPELCERLKKFTNNWTDVIRDADLNPCFFQKKSVYKIEDLESDYQKELQKIANLAETLGRSPLKSELESEAKKKMIARCGSWRNVLYQIGLEPVVKIRPFSSTYLGTAKNEPVRMHGTNLRDCYYKILHPDEQTTADLKELSQIRKALGHTPEKKEVAAELRKRLQKSCGSFANAVYQLKDTDDAERKEE